MGGRLFPQRARRPFVPNKGDEARQCRKKEPRTVLGRGSLSLVTRPESRVELVANRQDAEPKKSASTQGRRGLVVATHALGGWLLLLLRPAALSGAATRRGSRAAAEAASATTDGRGGGHQNQ
jgi:hypothetical protein